MELIMIIVIGILFMAATYLILSRSLLKLFWEPVYSVMVHICSF